MFVPSSFPTSSFSSFLLIQRPTLIQLRHNNTFTRSTRRMMMFCNLRSDVMSTTTTTATSKIILNNTSSCISTTGIMLLMKQQPYNKKYCYRNFGTSYYYYGGSVTSSSSFRTTGRTTNSIIATLRNNYNNNIIFCQQQQQRPLFIKTTLINDKLTTKTTTSFAQSSIRSNISHYNQKGSLAYLSSYNNNNQQQQQGPSNNNNSNRNRNRLGAGAGMIGAASVLFGKTKYVLAALKVTKLASLGSMIVSIGAYSMFFGVPYAIGVVGLIFVHEAGHAAVLYQRGVPFSPMVFLPFMGAVIATKQQPRDAWEDALIAAGGPIAGSIGAAGVAVAANMTDAQILYALADFGYMVNLFNLLPIGSMDGGRWVGAISKYAGLVGTGIGGYIAYNGLIYNPLFYLIWLAGSYETIMKFYKPNEYIPPNYYKITNIQRTALTAGYFSLIATLLTAMSINQQHKKSPEQLIREKQLQQEPTWDMR